MESTTNQESIIDIEENHENNSIITLWNFIAPKISVARNLLFSAITDLLEKSTFEETKRKKRSSSSLHWKNTQKSIWTLSTRAERQGSLHNIHSISPLGKVLNDTDSKSRSLHNFQFKCQSNEKLDEILSGKNEVHCLRLTEESSDVARFVLQRMEKQSESSSIGIFSEDSIVTETSYSPVEKKNNLVIRCNYNTPNQSSSQNILQVYRQDGSKKPLQFKKSLTFCDRLCENASRESAPSVRECRALKKRHLLVQTEKIKSERPCKCGSQSKVKPAASGRICGFMKRRHKNVETDNNKCELPCECRSHTESRGESGRESRPTKRNHPTPEREKTKSKFCKCSLHLPFKIKSTSTVKDGMPVKTQKNETQKKETQKNEENKSERINKTRTSKVTFDTANCQRCCEKIKEGSPKKKESSRPAFRSKFSRIVASGVPHVCEKSQRKNDEESSSSITTKMREASRSSCSTDPNDEVQLPAKCICSNTTGSPNRNTFDISTHAQLSHPPRTCERHQHLSPSRFKNCPRRVSNFRKTCKSTQCISSTCIVREFKHKCNSAKSGYLHSFCDLKTRIIASATSVCTIPDYSDFPISSRPRTRPCCTSKQLRPRLNNESQTDVNLISRCTNSCKRAPSHSIFSKAGKPQKRSRGCSPISNYEIPRCFCPARLSPSEVMICELNRNKGRLIDYRKPFFQEDASYIPLLSEENSSSDFDMQYQKNLLNWNEDYSHTKRKRNRSGRVSRGRYASNSLRPSRRLPGSYSSDNSSDQYCYEKTANNPPYEISYTPDDYRYRECYYPQQIGDYTVRPTYFPEEDMYYCPNYMLPYRSVAGTTERRSSPPTFNPTTSYSTRSQVPCPQSCLPSSSLINTPLFRTPPEPSPYYCYPHFSPPYSSQHYSPWSGSYPYIVDSYSSCSSKTSIATIPSSHRQPRITTRRVQYRRPISHRTEYRVPRAESLLCSQKSARKISNRKKKPEIFNRKIQVKRGKPLGFAKMYNSRSFNTPTHPERSCRPASVSGLNRFVSDVRMDSRYQGYPYSQVPNHVHHRSNHFSQVPMSYDASYPFEPYHSENYYGIDQTRSSRRRNQRSKKTSYSSSAFNRSSRPKTANSRDDSNISSSNCSLKSTSYPNYNSGNSTSSFSRSISTTISASYFLSKCNSTDNMPRRRSHQHKTSSCCSSKNSSECIINNETDKYPTKRVSCGLVDSSLKPSSSKQNFSSRNPRDTAFYRSDPAFVPSMSYRRIIGLRSQVCSSATDVHRNSKFRYEKINHYDDGIKFELQKIGINQLIEASKPAKCCKRTILNQPSKEHLPYAASLASLPLDTTDIKVIKQSVKMASKRKDFNYISSENRRKLMYYANILTDDFYSRKPKHEPKYEIRYIYYRVDDITKVRNLIDKKHDRKLKLIFLKMFDLNIPRLAYETERAFIHKIYSKIYCVSQNVTTRLLSENGCSLSPDLFLYYLKKGKRNSPETESRWINTHEWKPLEALKSSTSICLQQTESFVFMDSSLRSIDNRQNVRDYSDISFKLRKSSTVICTENKYNKSYVISRTSWSIFMFDGLLNFSQKIVKKMVILGNNRRLFSEESTNFIAGMSDLMQGNSSVRKFKKIKKKFRVFINTYQNSVNAKFNSTETELKILISGEIILSKIWKMEYFFRKNNLYLPLSSTTILRRQYVISQFLFRTENSPCFFIIDKDMFSINVMFDSTKSFINHIFCIKRNTTSNIYCVNPVSTRRKYKVKSLTADFASSIYIIQIYNYGCRFIEIYVHRTSKFDEIFASKTTVPVKITTEKKLNVFSSKSRKHKPCLTEVAQRLRCNSRKTQEYKKKISGERGMLYQSETKPFFIMFEIYENADKEPRKFTGELEITEEKISYNEKQKSERRKLHPNETKVVATVLPCYGTTGSIVQRGGDSLESLLDDYLEHGKFINREDKRRHARRNLINYQMVEDTLMECLNLTRNPNSMQRMSQTILQYFTYTVFNQIKNNYYKHYLQKQRHNSCNNYQETTVLYFNSKHSHAFSLGNIDINLKDNEEHPKSKEEKSKDSNKLNSSSQDHVGNTDSAPISNPSVSNIETKACSKDAFLCNLPNAPPFILKMNKTGFGTELTYANGGETIKDDHEYTSLPISRMDSLEQTRVSNASSATSCNLKSSGYSKMSKHNLFIDNTCPALSNQAFSGFVGKSISIIKNTKDILLRGPHGCFMSSPTVCMTGLSGFSINPFTMDGRDPRRHCQNISCRPSADILSNETSHQYQSKIPRMLHPGKYKVHTKMKNVQLSPGIKGYSVSRTQPCSSKACSDECPAEKIDVRINPNFKVSVSTTCPSVTNTCASAHLRTENISSRIKTVTLQKPVSQPSMGDCVKGIKSDPGCYCGHEVVESTLCPVRLKETLEYAEENTKTEVEEDNENMCYCPPADQPLLMKKSNIECDCVNRNRCENETLIEPPVEKPNVFWALTKVSLLKDGTKNFEIIDVSPLPPGYYLMPEVNNLVLVGPQPKPVKASPSKNCSCK